MGVNHLWQVMLPVGRRVGIETLEGKVLAVDVSIWLIQFVKAMRDAQTGRPIENAHILGSFRRLLKLVFARVRPVFVFDGVAPMLKRRTLMVRASRRKKASTSVRETARAILMNQIQQHHLAEATRARKAASAEASTSFDRPQFNRIETRRVGVAMVMSAATVLVAAFPRPAPALAKGRSARHPPRRLHASALKLPKKPPTFPQMVHLLVARARLAANRQARLTTSLIQ